MGKNQPSHRNAQARADAQDPAKVKAFAEAFWKLPSDQAMALKLLDYSYMEAACRQAGLISAATINLLFNDSAVQRGEANADKTVPWDGTLKVTVKQP